MSAEATKPEPLKLSLTYEELQQLCGLEFTNDPGASALYALGSELWAFGYALNDAVGGENFPQLVWAMSERCKGMAAVVAEHNAEQARRLVAPNLRTMLDALRPNDIGADDLSPELLMYALLDLAKAAGYSEAHIAAIRAMLDLVSGKTKLTDAEVSQ